MPMDVRISLFFLLLAIDCTLRYWVLKTSSPNFRTVDPHKAVRFLIELKDHLIPEWLMDQTIPVCQFVRRVKIEYIRS